MAEISYEEFSKMDLKVGTIISAEKIMGADKLYKLAVDLGSGETRTLVAGVAQQYSAEQLAGRQIVVVANLAPRTLRGVVSQGMLLAADADGAPVILSPDKGVPNGSKVK